MTEQELAAIEARAHAATAGPWVEYIGHGCYDQLKVVFYRPSRKAGHLLDKPVPIAACKVVYGDIDRVMARDNMAFIAHARADIPALLAEVRRLQALVGAPSEVTAACITCGALVREPVRRGAPRRYCPSCAAVSARARKRRWRRAARVLE